MYIPSSVFMSIGSSNLVTLPDPDAAPSIHDTDASAFCSGGGIVHPWTKILGV